MSTESSTPHNRQHATLHQRLDDEREQFNEWYEEQLKDIQPTEKDRNEHRIESVALLGVCLAFVYVLLTMPKLTLPLHIALIAFAVAAPSLLANYAIATNARPKNGTNNLFVQALWEMGTILGVGVGAIATAVGVLAIVWNLYPPAMWVLLGWSVAVTILIPLLAAGRWVTRLRQTTGESHRPTPPDVPVA